jgi:hypothetical protein
MTTPNGTLDVPRYVTAAAHLLGMPLRGERFDAVVTVMARIAAFAEHVAALELSHDVEVAGVFIP